MSDTRDPIQVLKDGVENRDGAAPKDSDLVEKFILYGPEKRAQFLDYLDGKTNDSDIADSVEGAARLLGLRRQFRNSHHRLREAKR